MSYSRIDDHAGMVFDDRRNRAFGAALRSAMQPGSVVLDLGAGLGLHGLMALQAGARHVYLVDPSPVVHFAGEVARRAGWTDRVTVIQDRIEDVDLPQGVDAIVSVFAGNLLFSEDLLPSLFHARDRYLLPGGKLLPDRAQLMLAPVSALSVHERRVARWSRPVMGIDCEALRAPAANEPVKLTREEAVQCELLAPARPLANVDFMSCADARCDGQARAEASAEGPCHGLLGWIRLHLAGEWLSTGPDEDPVHWSPVFLPIDPPIPLRPGEAIDISLTRPEFGDWTWGVTTAMHQRRHSTFYSNRDGPAQWTRIATHAAPGLGREGLRAKVVIDGLASGSTIAQIADAMRLADDGLKATEALRIARAYTSRFGGRA